RGASDFGSAQRRGGAPALGGARVRGRAAAQCAAPGHGAHRAGRGDRAAPRVRLRSRLSPRKGLAAPRAPRRRARLEGTGARTRGALLMRAVLLCALAASAVRAASPGALGDPMFYLHEDTYQLTPRRFSQWEAGRLAQQGNAWVDLGSVEGGRYDAVERGVLN